MKDLKDDFHATYDVWSTQKAFFVLHTTYKTPKKKKTRYIQRIKHLKGEISCYIHCMKHKKGNFGVTYNVWSVEKEKKHASERLRKS